MRLRRETAGPDAEESEVPVQQIKEHRTDSDTADSGRITQMAHYRGIDNSYQRNRYIRQYTRYGEA